MEIWKDIKGYEGFYKISNLGRVKRIARDITQRHYSGNISHYHLEEKIIKGIENNKGYIYINLTKNKKNTKKLIHRLVAEAFIKNSKNYKYINHKDNNPSNNNVNNLEWCSQSYNIKYAYDRGNKIPPHQRKIKQIKDNKIIKEFISIQEAERITRIKSSNISKCCRKLRNYAGGYKWEYAE